MAELLKDQYQGSPLRGLPVDDVEDTFVVTSVSGETDQFFYSNNGARTQDAGQAAGVVVSCNTAFSGIRNAAGDTQGTTLDSSLSFSSTAFTNLKVLPYEAMEAMDGMSFAQRLAYVVGPSCPVQLTSNGDYFVDYRKGVLYGIKASTQTTLTAVAYKYVSHTSTATVAGTVTAKIEDTAGNALTSTAGALDVNVKSETAVSNATTTAYATNLVVKASAGKLYQVTGYNSGPTQFIQFHDAASLPADTAVPKVVFKVLADSSFSWTCSGDIPRSFGTGIVLCNSSTGPTKTIGSADCWFDSQFV